MPNKTQIQPAATSGSRQLTSSSGNELVPIIRKDNIELVDGRLLYDFLKPGDSKYHRWISTRIKEYGFIKNFDYFNPNSGLKVKELKYELTLDMAKELAMVERTEMGRRVRKYFIEMERLAKKFIVSYPVLSLVDALEPGWYQYYSVLSELKYSKGGSAYKRQAGYPAYFRTIAGKICIHEDFVMILSDSKKLTAKRKEAKEKQLELPFEGKEVAHV